MIAHILIADDDEVSCQFFAETLESEGFRVQQVTSGDAALACLENTTYDLLIIDVRMRAHTWTTYAESVSRTSPCASGRHCIRMCHSREPSSETMSDRPSSCLRVAVVLQQEITRMPQSPVHSRHRSRRRPARSPA